MAPARASGDILKNGTAVVTNVALVPFMFVAPPVDWALDSVEADNPASNVNPISAMFFDILLLLYFLTFCKSISFYPFFQL